MSRPASTPSAAGGPQLAAVVLCGGASSRMGRPKALLPFGGQPMLERVVERLAPVCSPIILVAAAAGTQALSGADCEALEQLIERLCESPGVRRVRDERPERGPLEGLLAGLGALAALPAAPRAAYATSCDVPLLAPQWPAALAAQLGDAWAAVPVDSQYHHPLAAVYRVEAIPVLESLSARDELRPRKLFDLAPTVRVATESLRAIDPELATLANLNTPQDYLRALASQGLQRPADLLEHWREQGLLDPNLLDQHLLKQDLLETNPSECEADGH